MKILKNSLAFFVLLFIISGCHTNASKGKVNKTDSATYIVPKPGHISSADSIKFHNAIQGFYDTNLLNRGFNGGILVAKKGTILFEAYHGYFDLRKKDSLTRHSAFHLASVSKTFTAMATLKLQELNKLSINDSVQKYLPTFPYPGITIKMLLNHRSGLPNYIYFMEKLGWNTKQPCSNQDVLNYLVQYKPAATAPDKHFTYCNTNYALLGLIIEKASKMSYADFLQTYFFAPLHMDDTYVFNRVRDSAKAMPSYDFRGRQEPLNYLDDGFGDKNIYSTPEDLLKWDQALYSNELFTPQIMEEAYTPYSNEKPGVRNYGLGWRMNVYPDGKKIIYHNGWWHGNNTVFIRMIQDSVTIIVLGNKYNRNIYQAKKMAAFFSSGPDLQDE